MVYTVRLWVENDSVSIRVVPFQLRLPEGLHLGLKVEAARNRRSLQAEILQRLEESFVEPHVRVGDFVGDEHVVQSGPLSSFRGPDPRPGKRS